jgi:chromosome segregation ATPase
VDLTKYDMILSDLNIIESQASSVKDKFEELKNRNNELEDIVFLLKKEKNLLNQRIAQLESQLEQKPDVEENSDKLNLNVEEKEILKNKIKQLITKIDYHLSS